MAAYLESEETLKIRLVTTVLLNRGGTRDGARRFPSIYKLSPKGQGTPPNTAISMLVRNGFFVSKIAVTYEQFQWVLALKVLETVPKLIPLAPG